MDTNKIFNIFNIDSEEDSMDDMEDSMDDMEDSMDDMEAGMAREREQVNADAPAPGGNPSGAAPIGIETGEVVEVVWRLDDPEVLEDTWEALGEAVGLVLADPTMLMGPRGARRPTSGGPTSGRPTSGRQTAGRPTSGGPIYGGPFSVGRRPLAKGALQLLRHAYEMLEDDDCEMEEVIVISFWVVVLVILIILIILIVFFAQWVMSDFNSFYDRIKSFM